MNIDVDTVKEILGAMGLQSQTPPEEAQEITPHDVYEIHPSWSNGIFKVLDPNRNLLFLAPYETVIKLVMQYRMVENFTDAGTPYWSTPYWKRRLRDWIAEGNLPPKVFHP